MMRRGLSGGEEWCVSSGERVCVVSSGARVVRPPQLLRWAEVGAHLEAPSVRTAHLKLKQGRAINDDPPESVAAWGMRAADTPLGTALSRVVACCGNGFRRLYTVAVAGKRSFICIMVLNLRFIPSPKVGRLGPRLHGPKGKAPSRATARPRSLAGLSLSLLSTLMRTRLDAQLIQLQCLKSVARES